MATAGGQLVLRDAGSGQELWRASREEPGPLAAGDVDGDGLDELVLASGARIAVLEAVLETWLQRPLTDLPAGGMRIEEIAP